MTVGIEPSIFEVSTSRSLLYYLLFKHRFNDSKIFKVLDSNTDLDSRSIIVGGITENLALEKLIKTFQSTGDVKIIENIDVYDYDKIRLIYINEDGKSI